MIELRDHERASRWLAASLCTMRLGRPDDGRLGTALPWLVDAQSERGSLPPAGVVTDLGRMMAGESLHDVGPLPALSQRLRKALRGYEDHLLGRLDSSTKLDAIIDAYQALSPTNRSRALAVLLGRLTHRIGFSARVSVGPGTLRRVITAPAAELVHTGLETLGASDEIAEAIAAGYEDLTACARRAGTLLDDTDVFLVENIGVLGDLTHRLAIEQISEIAQQLAAGLPKRLKPRRQSLRGQINTQLEEEDHYPTGGFSSISTSGSLENLVISELIYMDDSAGGEVDLFDLRYAEGELLYYTRDEAVYTRGRRVIDIAFCDDLVRARIKDPEHAWQRLVTTLGVISCLVERLTTWLDSAALVIRIHFLGPREAPLAPEMRVVELMLREWIERGQVEVLANPSVDDVVAASADETRVAECDLVVVSMQRSTPVRAPRGVQSALLSLASPRPLVSWDHREAIAPEDAGSAWDAWRQATLLLLQEMI